MSDNKNMKLWESVEKTDPAMTKRVNQRGGYTSISPQYQLKLATNQFGSYGDGWGLKDSKFDDKFFELYGVIIHSAIFFYTLNGNRVEFEINNSIEAANTKSGRFDTDAFKKVETNTISKALSKLGFNADVFMGKFDDVDYFNEVQTESINEKANAKDDAAVKALKEFKNEFNTYLNKLSESENNATLNQCFKLYKNKILRACTKLGKDSKPYLERLEEVAKETKTKLEGDKK